MKTVTKSKFLAFFAVIALFSAVIFAGGCDGSSSSSPSKTISAGVLSGEMDEIFEKELKEEGVVFETLSLDSSPTKLIVVGEGAAIDETQLEYLGNALASGSVVAFEEASKEQLAQFGEMLGTPLDVYGADDGIYFTAVSTHGGHTHIYLLGKDYETKFEVKDEVKVIEPTEEEKKKELEEAEKEGETDSDVEEASGEVPEERELTAEERKQQVMDCHAGKLVEWINEGIEQETERVNEGSEEVARNLDGNSNSVNELSKCIGATVIGKPIFDPKYELHNESGKEFGKGNFETPRFLWASANPTIMIWSIHKFEDNTDYYYVKNEFTADPSNAELPKYCPELTTRKERDGWLNGWYDYSKQGIEKLFYGNNPRDKGFFWYFDGYIYHGYPEPNYYNTVQPLDKGIYRAWSVKYSWFRKDSFWLNYMKELYTEAVPTNELNNADLYMLEHKPNQSTRTETRVTETSSWNVGGNIGITPQWEKEQPKKNQNLQGLPFAGMLPIGLSAGGGKTTTRERNVKDCYLYSGVYQIGGKHVSPTVRYEFYDFGDPQRRMSRSNNLHSDSQDDTSPVSRTSFTVTSDWLWKFDSKKLRALTPEQRSFTSNFDYITAGTSDRAGGSLVQVGKSKRFSQKVLLPLSPSLVAQNLKANAFSGSGKKDYTTISTDSKAKTDGVAVQVFSSDEWTVTSNQEWCRPQVKQGEWQPATVKLLNLTIDANDTTTQRTAEVTFTSKGEKKYCRVEVVQSAGKAR